MGDTSVLVEYKCTFIQYEYAWSHTDVLRGFSAYWGRLALVPLR